MYFSSNIKFGKRLKCRYKIIATCRTTNSEDTKKVAQTNDYSSGENWMLTTAREFKAAHLGQSDLNIIVSMFDNTIKDGPNLIAQYEKRSGYEKFYSIMPTSL